MDQSTNYTEDFIDLRQYARILWRWTWLIILCAVLAGGAAYFVSRSTTPVYQASTTLLINQAPDSRSSDYTALLMSERLARTYAEMITQRPVLEATLERLELDMRVESLRGAVSVQPVRDTQLITLSVEDTSRSMAAKLANTLAEVFQEQIDDLQHARFAESKPSLETAIATAIANESEEAELTHT
ncbi:MAG: Wzz/FepE/Etk N-terminal domain-containing protein, partial [Anaerolineales bacterium]